MEIRRVRSTSRTEARMVIVWSRVMFMSMALLIEACNCGSAALMPSTVSMMFAPGWRKMINKRRAFSIRQT